MACRGRGGQALTLALLATLLVCAAALLRGPAGTPSSRASIPHSPTYTPTYTYTPTGTRLYSYNYPGERVLRSRRKQPGTLILVRHGESQWNANYTFTGWADPDLSDLGRREVKRASRLLLEQGYKVDIAYTSLLKRAISTTWILLRELGIVYLPVVKDHRLNERMYGALTGESKPETALKYGESVVQDWRRSLRVRPPPLDENHPYYPGRERKYEKLSKAEIPLTESLLDTMFRSIPLWEDEIKRDIVNGKNVLVTAHANSLRGLIKHIDGISEDDIPAVGIPNCIPLVYKFDRDMQPIKQEHAVAPLSGAYLATREATRAALRREKQLSLSLPGYTDDYQYNTPVVSALRQLFDERAAADRLEQAQAAAKAAAEEAAAAAAEVKTAECEKAAADKAAADKVAGITMGDAAMFGVDMGALAPTSPAKAPASPQPAGSPKSQKETAKTPRQWAQSNPTGGLITREGVRSNAPIVVMIRHGKTEYNKLGLFTGWEDAPLSKDGVKEARHAGELMRYHGLKVDVVYTSWLSRAIETAWLALEELDDTW